jgi:hypothetical protein
MSWACREEPLNITVQKDEFRVAILGRVFSFALVGPKIGCRPTPAGSNVMLIGSSPRREG